MLNLRTESIEEMDRQRWEAFLDRLHQHVGRQLSRAGHAVPPRSDVERAAALACGYGFATEHEIAYFTELLMLFGLDPHDPRARELLEDRGLSGESKLSLLGELCSGEESVRKEG